MPYLVRPSFLLRRPPAMLSTAKVSCYLSENFEVYRPGMMTFCHGNAFHITDPLCRESFGNRWIICTEVSDVCVCVEGGGGGGGGGVQASVFIFMSAKKIDWTNFRVNGDMKPYNVNMPSRNVSGKVLQSFGAGASTSTALSSCPIHEREQRLVSLGRMQNCFPYPSSAYARWSKWWHSNDDLVAGHWLQYQYLPQLIRLFETMNADGGCKCWSVFALSRK